MAGFFKGLHVGDTVDYTKKYFQEASAELDGKTPRVVIAIKETPFYPELKRYRYVISKAEGIKLYYIYSNAQMYELITAIPKICKILKNIRVWGS